MATLSVKPRVALAIAAVLVLLIVPRALGLTAWLEIERVRSAVQSAGVFGPLAFVGLFVGAALMQVPGIPFLALAPALFPFLLAVVLCIVASHASVALNFAIVRRLGGTPLKALEQPLLTRLFTELDAHPVRTVLLLRLITVMFPPVTSALALTSVSARDHFVGTLLGMTPPVLLILLASAFIFGGAAP